MADFGNALRSIDRAKHPRPAEKFLAHFQAIAGRWRSDPARFRAGRRFELEADFARLLFVRKFPEKKET